MKYLSKMKELADVRTYSGGGIAPGDYLCVFPIDSEGDVPTSPGYSPPGPCFPPPMPVLTM